MAVKNETLRTLEQQLKELRNDKLLRSKSLFTAYCNCQLLTEPLQPSIILVLHRSCILLYQDYDLNILLLSKCVPAFQWD